MKFVELDPNEERIIVELRSLKPSEKMEIIADPTGKPAAWIINRLSRQVLIEGVVSFVKFKA